MYNILLGAHELYYSPRDVRILCGLLIGEYSIAKTHSKNN